MLSKYKFLKFLTSEGINNSIILNTIPFLQEDQQKLENDFNIKRLFDQQHENLIFKENIFKNNENIDFVM